MPVKQLLKLGRRAVIELQEHYNSPIKIYANGELIAKGEIMVSGENISITLIEGVKGFRELGVVKKHKKFSFLLRYSLSFDISPQ